MARPSILVQQYWNRDPVSFRIGPAYNDPEEVMAWDRRFTEPDFSCAD